MITVPAMFLKNIHLFLMLVMLCSLSALASNEPQETVWSPILDLTNHTEVLLIRYSGDGKAVVETPKQELLLFEGLRRLEINSSLYWMNGPFVYLKDQWQVTESDMNNTIGPLVSPMTPQPTNTPFIVVIDPGHGGHDPGAVEGKLLEKDLVLKVAKELHTKLIDKGITTKLTRTNDTFITLSARPIMARQLNASIMISVHANRAHSQAASGVETYVLPAAGFPGTSNSRAPKYISLVGNRFDVQNLLLADSVHRRVIQKTHSLDRGIKRERFAVLRTAPCPAVLVEIGFMSHASDRKKLQNPKWIHKLTDAMLDGIIAYKNGTKESK